ncbi:MAG: ABC transporter permease subunit [SAR324 cluster bacterium]|nr:ABC transporter permease subunit [SAR324 cluster bacterium]
MGEGAKFFFKSLFQNKAAFLGLVIIIFVFALALGADFIAPYDASYQDRESFLLPPSWEEGGSSKYLLGTDPIGRDLLSRIIHGSRYSIFIGVSVVSLSLIIGIIGGVIAGYFGGMIDFVIMRLMDILLAFPSLLLALVIASILGPGLVNAAIAITVVQLPHFIRLTRAEVMQHKTKEYYTATKVIGASKIRLMFITLLPNCFSPLIVQGTLNFSNAILDAAALGFLGLGAQPPTPEWGTMLADAREFVLSAWWVVTFPGLAILITVMAINVFGDGLRDILDPKLRKS